MKVAFVENKTPDLDRVGRLFARCAEQNSWANRGPLYARLRETYCDYMRLSPDLTVVPLANAGAALEAMARLLAKRAGRKLRWLGSPFSFRNLGRGYFADMHFVDCDEGGLLDLAVLERTDHESYDGVVLTNPFGLRVDFSAYVAFAARQGKALILDNASGIHSCVPDWPWQAFSLHQTKPHGVGEGALALVPAELAEDLYELVNYGEDGHGSAHWFQNAKLSDISCAFLIDRLERADQWRPLYQEQSQRVRTIAGELGLFPLCDPETAIPMTSMPLVAPLPINQEATHATEHLTFAKYYKPLTQQPRVMQLYAHLINVPCHADVGRVSDRDLQSDLLRCLDFQHQDHASGRELEDAV